MTPLHPITFAYPGLSREQSFSGEMCKQKVIPHASTTKRVETIGVQTTNYRCEHIQVYQERQKANPKTLEENTIPICYRTPWERQKTRKHFIETDSF